MPKKIFTFNRPFVAGQDAGFTLVELMISLAIGAFVLAAVLGGMLDLERARSRQTHVAGLRQDLWAIARVIERDLRAAGSGFSNLKIEGSDQGNPTSYAALSPGYDATGSDSISIIGAVEGISALLRAPMPTPTDDFQCTTVDGFAVGDLVVVTDGTHADLFQITGLQQALRNLQHDQTSPLNHPGGRSNWPTGGYQAGDRLYKVQMVTYTHDPSSGKVTRKPSGSPAQIVGGHVDKLKFKYLMEDGTYDASPDTTESIRAVRIDIFGFVLTDQGEVIEDSLECDLAPRCF